LRRCFNAHADGMKAKKNFRGGRHAQLSPGRCNADAAV
jgi:hypothetical protein